MAKYIYAIAFVVLTLGLIRVFVLNDILFSGHSGLLLLVVAMSSLGGLAAWATWKRQKLAWLLVAAILVLMSIVLCVINDIPLWLVMRLSGEIAISAIIIWAARIVAFGDQTA